MKFSLLVHIGVVKFALSVFRVAFLVFRFMLRVVLIWLLSASHASLYILDRLVSIIEGGLSFLPRLLLS